MAELNTPRQIKRASGLLLHPTSLPGPFGIGDLGPAAYQWVDRLAEAGVQLWQVLPLGQTGYGDSPYQCFSAFAGNKYLISPELLTADGFMPPEPPPNFPVERVDYGWAISWKNDYLYQAADQFLQNEQHPLAGLFKEFIEKNSNWLNGYAQFMVAKELNGGNSWLDWPDELRLRRPAAIDALMTDHPYEIRLEQVYQFMFFRQWARLKAYANALRVRIIGDLPIFVSMDSADVWLNPSLFKLDNKLRPTAVAGVPSDYFSPTGQLWGNPLYKWPAHSAEDFSWWIERIKANLHLFDYIRLDHFRGFYGYWQVPAGESTAVRGRWMPGPRQPFFDAIFSHFKHLPLIAEDLGVITKEVAALRDTNQLPGMRVMQFAFDKNAANPFLPHNYITNCVAYTGTHDNNTTSGWFNTLSADEAAYVLNYLGIADPGQVTPAMIRTLWQSVAGIAIIPMQDLLNLGADARMNMPGQAGGNWSWRLSSEQLHDESAWRWLQTLNNLYGR